MGQKKKKEITGSASDILNLRCYRTPSWKSSWKFSSIYIKEVVGETDANSAVFDT